MRLRIDDPALLAVTSGSAAATHPVETPERLLASYVHEPFRPYLGQRLAEALRGRLRRTDPVLAEVDIAMVGADDPPAANVTTTHEGRVRR